MALSSEPNHQRRTHSYSDGPISTSLNRPAKPPPLQTIPSGKYSLNIIQSSQVNLADMDTIKRRKPPRRSTSELEWELELELEGLKICDTDEVEVERSDIVPGLQRKKKSEVKVKGKTRRYSSDWRPIDEDERRRVLGDWSVLTNGDERDVKDQLRQWAHVVASSQPLR